MKKTWSVLPAFAGTLLLFASCYPGELTNIAELDIVVTTHDDTVTFTSFATYVLLDSVVHIDLMDNANDNLLDRASAPTSRTTSGVVLAGSISST